MMQSPLQQSVRGVVRVWMEHWPGGAKVMETARGQAGRIHQSNESSIRDVFHTSRCMMVINWCQ